MLSFNFPPCGAPWHKDLKSTNRTGIGTILASMLPYSIAFLIGWVILLLLWVFAGWPLGPGAEAFYAINS